MNIISKTILKNGENLILRQPTSEDAKDMIEYLNIVGGESDNLLFGEGEFNLTVEQEITHIENTNKNPNVLMIVGIIDDKIVSIAQICSFSKKRIAHNSEIAISVKKEYWNIGIGSFVMNTLINFAKNHNTIKNISLGVKASNHNAIKLYEKHGFQKVGIHKNFFNINDEFDDEIIMDLTI